MKAPQRKLLTAAITLALATGTAYGALERMGPVNKAATVGGYPAWFQDKTGITLEFCDLQSQAELNGGWCVLIPPGLSYPENFPDAFFGEHFYYIADNGLKDAAPPGGFRARLVLAVEAAFATGAVIDGDQMTFGRHRVFIPNLPWDGDYRVITPFSDVTYFDQKAGDRIFETSDVGIACINTFECTLGTVIGPYLLPSARAGGAEVPPMPDLKTAPRGTDPFYDLLVDAGTPTPDPGTGKIYIADPARIGPVTGSPLPPFTDSTGKKRDHNTFRIEVRAPDPINHNGAVIYTIDGESNFTTSGRLMNAAIPSKVTSDRASYKADNLGNVTDLDVFATASPAVPPRIPAQLPPPVVTQVLSFFDAPCTGALATDPNTGVTTVNPPPYSAPAGVAHPMAPTGKTYWGQSQPGGKPPTHVCIEDSTARNAAGQVVPAYYLRNVTDDVTVGLAWYTGQNGVLTVNAVSSDPTARLTLAGYGPAPATTPGAITGVGAGSGLVLAGNVATVSSISAPPAEVQVVSSKGGSALQPVQTGHGAAVLIGVPVAVNNSATIFEDCSPSPASFCPGRGVLIDLLANDTVLFHGSITNVRLLATSGQAKVIVDAQAPRFGLASVANGYLSYTPNPNANGTDTVTYTVSVDGKVSNPAVASIIVTPVNDAPVAVNDATNAVIGKPNSFNLIAKATDPDGNADVKNAIITTWPAQLGTQPIPVNGVISFTPTSAGNFNVAYRVKDAAGLLSANTATATVTVFANEAIAFTKSIFKGAGKIGGAASTRWTVTGTDSVKQGQTLSIVYNDGTLSNAGGTCDGTATIPSCVIGTAAVDNLGNFTLDKVGTPGGPLDPNDTATWATKPTSIKVFSSAPVLGGASSIGIQFK